jgi:hypothetical protein
MNALDQLVTVFDHRVRLAIGVLLARHGEISFARLKEQLELTDDDRPDEGRLCATRTLRLFGFG